MRLATVSRGTVYAVAILMLALLLALAAFVVGQQHRLPPPLGLAANGLIADDANGQITLFSPTGEVQRTLTSSGEIAISPKFSADGQRVAFWAAARPAGLPASATSLDILNAIKSGKASIVIADAEGSTRRILGSDISIGDWGELSPSWSHKGDAIAYGSDVSSGYNQIYVVPTAASGQPVKIDFAVTPTWSPDDSLIAYAKTVGLFVANRDGTNERQLSKAHGLDFAFINPDWSPDGSKIAFMAGDQPLYSIVVANVDGSGESTVAQPVAGMQVYWPRFSPDGTKLAYQRLVQRGDDGGEIVNFVVANADGSNPRTLPGDYWVGYAGWSPDGKYLVGFNATAGVPNTFLIDATTGTARPIARDSQGVSWQRLAP
jgi:Tol biopolymer transport system component